MNLNDINKIFFVGIGGIGMSALARFFSKQGKKVSGYDKTPTSLTDTLISEGIHVVFEDSLESIDKEVDLVVYTPAIPSSHIGLNFYFENKYNVLKRSEVLGLISKDKFSICVAGSHGKTTVSSMIAHILNHSGYGCTSFLGGIAVNYKSNFVSPPSNAKRNDVVVIEADEFDRSFHRLSPDIAVITAVDTDHLDIYGSKEKIDEAFVEFTKKIDEEGVLIIRSNQSIEFSLPMLDKTFYSLDDRSSDVYCDKYWIVDGGYLFTLSYFDKKYPGLRLNIGGYHNIENALAAISVAKELGISIAQIHDALVTFKGIKRRFEKVYDSSSVVYIDDYAHHPQEIDVLLKSVKEIYPDKNIIALFQPHLFSRTKDLSVEFAKSLSIVDELFLLDIYPARELPMEGVTSHLILDKATSKQKSIVTPNDFLKRLESIDNAVILTIGAGDIDKLVSPIAKLLNTNKIN